MKIGNCRDRIKDLPRFLGRNDSLFLVYKVSFFEEKCQPLNKEEIMKL